jgi:MFS family permease
MTAAGRSVRAAGALPRVPVIVVGVAMLAISTTAFFRISLLPEIGDDLRMSAGQLSLITTVFAVGRLLTDIPAGRIADRIPAPRLLSTAGLGIAAGSALFAVAGGPLVLYLGAVLLGISSATANTTGMTFFSTVAGHARRGTSMAVFSAALLGGQALGPLISGLLTSLGSWRTAVAVGAGIGVCVAVILRTAPHARRVAEAAMAEPEFGYGVHARGERLILHGVSFASFFSMGAIPQTLVPLIGGDELDLSAVAIGLALGLGGVCRFAGSMAGGVISDRVSRKSALVPGLAVMTLGVVLLSPQLTTGLWVAAIAVFSVGSFGISVAATILADRANTGAVGRRFGTFRLAGDVGLMIGPAVGGFLYSHVNQHVAVLTIAAVLGTCTLSCAIGIRGGANREGLV